MDLGNLNNCNFLIDIWNFLNSYSELFKIYFYGFVSMLVFLSFVGGFIREEPNKYNFIFALIWPVYLINFLGLVVRNILDMIIKSRM